MNAVRAAIIAAVLIITGSAVFAQQGPGSEADARKREEVRKKVEAVRIWRLTEALKLDEKTSARLSSFLSVLDEQRRGLVRERMETLRDLRPLLKPERPDEKKLKIALDKLDKNRLAMADLEEKENAGVKDILTVEQRARYVIFQHEFRREIRGMIAGARGGAQQGAHDSGAAGGPVQPAPGKQPAR